MNIFLSDPCPRACAVALDDKRVVKMALETAQLLSTACDYHLNVKLGYRSTHGNHPCSIWARSGNQNYAWLVEHGIWLCDEYDYRFGRRHNSLQIIENSAQYRHQFPDSPLAFTFNSSGQESGVDVFTDYQLCLVNKWKYLDVLKPRWTRRDKPLFFKKR